MKDTEVQRLLQERLDKLGERFMQDAFDEEPGQKRKHRESENESETQPTSSVILKKSKSGVEPSHLGKVPVAETKVDPLAFLYGTKKKRMSDSEKLAFDSEQRKKRAKENKAAEAEFKTINREVVNLGKSQLGKREQKDLEKRRILAAGGKITTPKVPLKILQGMKKKAVERNEKQWLKEKEMGGSKKKPKLRAPEKRDRSGDAVRPSVGKLMGGVLQLSKRDIARIGSGGSGPVKRTNKDKGRVRDIDHADKKTHKRKPKNPLKGLNI